MQYAGAMILFGSSLFFVRALPQGGPGSAGEMRWPRTLLAAAGVGLCISALLWLAAQASVLAGSITEGLRPQTLLAVVTGFDLGKAALARAALAALAAILVLTIKPARTAWRACTLAGGLATASLAWLGHGAATEGSGGPVHLISDILHSWAAAAWIGALVAFLLLLRACARRPELTATLHRALHGFSGLGTVLVAVLIATGLVNSWFLIGPQRLEGLWTTPYGQLLSVKLVLFVGMLGMAAANRFRLTPALAGAPDAGPRQRSALRALRRSIVVETALAFGVLALVAGFGTLPPPAAV
jgi:copper resistance protein D